MWNHPDVEPPDGFLHAAGLVMIPEQIRPREGRAWLVDWQGTRGVFTLGDGEGRGEAPDPLL
jgi:hypothetical protein